MTTLYFRIRASAAAPQPWPLLERLLTRADAKVPVTDWRADAVRSQALPGQVVPGQALPGQALHGQTVPGQALSGQTLRGQTVPGQALSGPALSVEPFAAGPVALMAASGPVGGAWACIATPVHYSAEISNVRLARDGILRLGAERAAALALDFNRVWRDSGIHLGAGKFADLFCIFDRPLAVATQEPERVLDKHIEAFLPQGADAPRLRQLMSEMEMWLFEHPAMGKPARDASPVNGLWLWGGGVTRGAALPEGLNCSGKDAVFSYFGGDVSRGGIVIADVDGGANANANANAGANANANAGANANANAGANANANADADADASAQELEAAHGRLKSGELERILISAGDFCYAVSRSNLRRFWRRGRRPWNEYFI